MRSLFPGTAILGFCLAGVVAGPLSAQDTHAYPNIPNNPNAAGGEISCTGYQHYQFAATGLNASTAYTAVVNMTASCPGSSQPVTKSFNINFSTPATVTGNAGDPAFGPVDYISVGDPNCTPSASAYCVANPGLPTGTTSVQNYDPSLKINGPLSMNAFDSATNNACSASSTITLTATPSGVAPTPVNMEGNFSPNAMTVVCTATPSCVISPSKTAIGGAPVSWNKFTAPAGSVVWLNAHIGSPSNLLPNQLTEIQFTGGTLTVNSTSYKLPDGFLEIDPAYTGSAPTTKFVPGFAGLGAWVTTLNPKQLSSELFFTGAAIPVDANLMSGGGAVVSYTTLSNDSSVSFNWQWSAAVYTYWPGDWNAANIEAYNGAYHAGAPQNKQVQASLIQGPRGGGGSNYTGSWSGTGTGVCTNNF